MLFYHYSSTCHWWNTFRGKSCENVSYFAVELTLCEHSYDVVNYWFSFIIAAHVENIWINWYTFAYQTGDNHRHCKTLRDTWTRDSEGPKSIGCFGVSLSLGAPLTSGPLDIVHPVHPLATPWLQTLLIAWVNLTQSSIPVCHSTFRLFSCMSLWKEGSVLFRSISLCCWALAAILVW